MRKPLLILTGAVISLALLYTSSVVFIAKQVEAELADYRSVLVARDDIRVVQFEYQHGFWGGLLTYDVSWLPAQSPQYIGVAEQLPDFFENDIRMAGEVDIKHGPWLGGEGLGLASFGQESGLPDEWREALPQYPGQAPLVAITGKINFRGNLNTTARLVDYDGRVMLDDQTADLLVHGLQMSMAANEDLSVVDLGMNVDELTISVPDEMMLEVRNAQVQQALLKNDPELDISSQAHIQRFTLRFPEEFEFVQSDFGLVADYRGNGPLSVSDFSNLQSLAMDVGIRDISINELGMVTPGTINLEELNIQGELNQDSSSAMLTRSAFKLERLLVDIPQDDVDFALEGLETTGDIQRVGETVESRSDLTLQALQIKDQLIGGIEMAASMKGLNIDSYALLTNVNDLDPSPADFEAMQSALQAIVQDKINISLERLVVSLPDEEDVTAMFSLDYDGSSQINMSDLNEILQAIRLESSVQASMPAIDRTIANADLSAARENDLTLLLQGLYQLPYVTVSNDIASSSLQIEQGEVSVNGEAVGPLMDMVMMAQMGFAGAGGVQPGGAAQCPTPGPGSMTMDASSDDLYTPQTRNVDAGGPVNLGQCMTMPGQGYLKLAPDMTLNLTENTQGRVLAFRTDSECDSILMINDSDGRWHYDDDSNGNSDAQVMMKNAKNGQYHVWVGTFYPERACSSVLLMETF